MEAILRIRPANPDIEVLVNDGNLEEFIEKTISIEKMIEILKRYNIKENLNAKPNIIYDDRYLLKYDNYVLINQPAHKRVITYSNSNENRAFNINFPNSIYLVEIKNDSIVSIEAYMYFEWKGGNTKLYKYGMPNKLSGNQICIGSAPRGIKDNNVIEALENIIYVPYSHRELSDVKGFSNTIQYFEYLSESEISTKNLYVAKKILKNIFKEDKND